MTHQHISDAAQDQRNAALIAASPALGAHFTSRVVPFTLAPAARPLTPTDVTTLAALEKCAATVAIKAAASLARAGDIDHLGGALDLIPALLMTLASIDYDRRLEYRRC